MGQTLITSFEVPYPPDVTAANLFRLREYPPQTFDVWLGRPWPRALAVLTRTVAVKQPHPDSYQFTVTFRWQDRREVMFPEYRLVVFGNIMPHSDGHGLVHVTRLCYRPNYRSWTPAMAAVGALAVLLFPVLWWLQGLIFGTIFVGLYGLLILVGASSLWIAYRRAVAWAAIALLRQGAGVEDPPVSEWHALLYPEDFTDQHNREPEP